MWFFHVVQADHKYHFCRQLLIVLEQANLFFPSDLLFPCCPNSIESKENSNKNFTIFKSTQITHWWCSYFICCKKVFIASYFSFNVVECPIGIGAYIFELRKRTHFKLFLELSINNLYSSGLYSLAQTLVIPQKIWEIRHLLFCRK